MKNYLITFLLGLLSFVLFGQNGPVSPGIIKTAVYFDISPPLSDLPPLTPEELEIMKEKALKKAKNKGLGDRIYPFTDRAFPKGPDEVWQKEMGTTSISKAPTVNFAGQSSPYYPPDCNGDVGPNHYFQTVNTTYAIYTKTGTLLAGPTAMNSLFSGVTGSQYNNGDPIILYDEHADRWLAAEFSLDGSTDYMLIAVSTSPDPTNTWYRWSFDVDDMPDYMKFGIQRDGYYMSTNTYGGLNNAYVFERDVMLVGGASPTMVGFPNPWRPPGFHCIQPIDCDADFPPVGTPGQFITINDDAIGGGNDELRIFELTVDWITPSNSSFNLVQQLSVTAFDSQFNAWGVGDITQPGTSQLLDAIPQVLMYRSQYRNFCSSQNIVCMHTVDVNGSNHAGIRWYELENTSGSWTVRQEGTYAPDAHSRWMGSIAMNDQRAIALGYTVSSSSVYPSMRYSGQSPAENALASGVLDIAEDVIQAGTTSQTAYNRWGDYSFMSVDPSNNQTFWYTSEYIGSGGSRQTRIAAFEFPLAPLTSDFCADPRSICVGSSVNFIDASLGEPTSWTWSFPGGTPSSFSGQNPPSISYSSPGTYNVSLVVSDGVGTDPETKSSYITVSNIIADFSGAPTNILIGNTVTFTDNSSCDPVSWSWSFPGGTPNSATGIGPHVIVYNSAGNYNVSLIVNNGSGSDTKTESNYISVTTCNPCSAGGSAGDEEWISNVTFNTINNSSVAGLGYNDYTSISTDVETNAIHNLSVSCGSTGAWTENYWAFFDWNQDCDFDDAGEAYDLGQTSGPGTLNTNITVPTNAASGTSIMRVIIKFSADPTSCELFSYGEVEDYSINVVRDITLDMKAFLEGPFNGTNMNTNIIPHLPLSQPFNITPWNYTGTESVESIPANVVDWVLIDVRDAATAATATSGTSVAKQAAFILNNGSIVGLDGSSNLTFDVSITQNLYVVVWHRNHLGIMSNSALTAVGGLYTYDYTTGINQVFGEIDGHKQISIGIWGMIGGDGTHDGLVNINDNSPLWENEAGEQGYIFSDHNLDGESNNQDKDDIWVPNEGKSSQVPN